MCLSILSPTPPSPAVMGNYVEISPVRPQKLPYRWKFDFGCLTEEYGITHMYICCVLRSVTLSYLRQVVSLLKYISPQCPYLNLLGSWELPEDLLIAYAPCMG